MPNHITAHKGNSKHYQKQDKKNLRPHSSPVKKLKHGVSLKSHCFTEGNEMPDKDPHKICPLGKPGPTHLHKSRAYAYLRAAFETQPYVRRGHRLTIDHPPLLQTFCTY